MQVVTARPPSFSHSGRFDGFWKVFRAVLRYSIPCLRRQRLARCLARVTSNDKAVTERGKRWQKRVYELPELDAGIRGIVPNFSSDIRQLADRPETASIFGAGTW